MPKTQLPEYSSLVRWTVQDVVSWLVQIGFNDCTRIFREAGVDGNKLANLTDTELKRISCPSRRIKDLVKYVNEVGPPPQPPPSSNRGFMMRQPPAPVKKDYSAPAPPPPQTNDEGIASGSDDDIAWDEEEFDTDSEGSESDRSYEDPVEPSTPPRPAARNGGRPPAPTPIHQHQVRSGPPAFSGHGRPPPPVPQYEQEENYEDPDAGLPTVASPPPPSVRTLPPSRRKAPSPPPVQEETYEDPDAKPLSLPATVPRRKAPSPAPVQNGGEEEYEEPDPNIQAPPPSRRPQPPPPRIPAPAAPAPWEAEDYEEPDNTLKPVGRRPPQPIPNPEPISQDVYEDPDSQVFVQPTHGGPLPTPPGHKPPVPTTQKEPPPRRKHGGMQQLPTPPKPVEPEEQDVYEIPAEEESSAPPKPPPGRRGLPPTPQESQDQDDYLEMDDAQLPPPPAKTLLPKQSKDKAPAPSKNNSRWKPPEPQPAPREPVEEECYEDPDATPEPPTRRGPAGAVPILPGLKMLNINDEPRKKPPEKKQPANKAKRVLPPPPSAEEPAPEPVKPEPVKPEPRIPEPVKPEPRKPEPKTAQIKSTEESSEGDLESYPWYHGQITRQQADSRLKQIAMDGMYCIRKSSGGGDRPYTLAVFYENKVYNLPVRRRADRKYALGAEKKGEHKFATLLEMINFFKKNYLVIHASDSGQTRLVKSLPKS